MMRSVIFCIALSAWFPAVSGAQDIDSAFFNAVVDYITTEEAIEQYKGKSFEPRLMSAVTADFDDDGIMELYLHIDPYYRQSPSILVFRMIDGKVERAAEGFLPGYPVPMTDAFYDFHNYNAAFDMYAQGGISTENLIASTEKIGGGCLVVYENFNHMDTREGRFTYVDMTHLKEYPGKENRNCSGFEIPPARQVVNGKDASGTECLWALVENSVFKYVIKGFGQDGLIDNTLEIIDYRADVYTLGVQDGFVHAYGLDGEVLGDE